LVFAELSQQTNLQQLTEVAQHKIDELLHIPHFSLPSIYQGGFNTFAWNQEKIQNLFKFTQESLAQVQKTFSLAEKINDNQVPNELHEILLDFVHQKEMGELH
jgi:hypothetical protein